MERGRVMSREHVLMIKVKVTDETDEMDVLHGLMRGEARGTIEAFLCNQINDCVIHGYSVSEGDVWHVVEGMEWDDE